jgi:hypothetical protein
MKYSTEPPFKKYDLQVQDVHLVKESAAKFSGVVTIRYKDQDHSVGIKVLTDRDSLMYEAEPLGFLIEEEAAEIQKRVQSQLAQLSPFPTVPDTNTSESTITERRLISQEGVTKLRRCELSYTDAEGLQQNGGNLGQLIDSISKVKNDDGQGLSAIAYARGEDTEIDILGALKDNAAFTLILNCAGYSCLLVSGESGQKTLTSQEAMQFMGILVLGSKLQESKGTN